MGATILNFWSLSPRHALYAYLHSPYSEYRFPILITIVFFILVAIYNTFTTLLHLDSRFLPGISTFVFPHDAFRKRGLGSTSSLYEQDHSKWWRSTHKYVGDDAGKTNLFCFCNKLQRYTYQVSFSFATNYSTNAMFQREHRHKFGVTLFEAYTVHSDNGHTLDPCVVKLFIFCDHWDL